MEVPATSRGRRRNVKHRSLAVLASSVLPGWGQAYLGNRSQAVWRFAADGLILGTALIIFGWLRLEAVKLWVSPLALLAMSAGNLLLLVFRGSAALSTYRSAPPEPTKAGSLVTLLLASSILVVPHLVVGYAVFVQYDLIETVFVDPAPVAGATTTTIPADATTTPVITSTSSVAASTTTTLVPSTTTTEPPFWDGFQRLNVALLGADAGEGRTGVRTDTTIVVSIDPESGYTTMLSVPRDLSGAPLPPGMGVWSCNCFPDLIAHLYDAAERNPDAFPGPAEAPFNAIKGALGEILGMPIHYYAMVTLDGFVGVIDALGGVTIAVPKTVVDETYPHEDGSTQHVVIEAGERHLDGHLALAYVRIRRHSDDFARMHRQRCVLEAVVSQTGPLELFAQFGVIADAVKENVSTDIPRDRLVDLVDLVAKMSTERIATLRITRAEYQTGAAPGRVYYDIERIRKDAQALIDDPNATQGQLGLSPLDTSCELSFD